MSDRYEIFIFTSDRDLGDSQPYTNTPLKIWVKKSGIFVYYAPPEALKWKIILKEIKAVHPNFIYLNGMYARYYAIYPLLMKRIGKTDAKVILAPRGMLQYGALRFKTQKKKFFLRVLNFLEIPKCITAHATDEQEKRDIKRYLHEINEIVVLPNFSATHQNDPVYISKLPNTLRCIFISRISPKKNLLFFIGLLTKLPSFINLTFVIRGNIESNEYWRKCEDVIKTLPKNISVKYEGAVNNDEVVSLIQQYHTFVLPTLGENFGHAIFEAFSAGRPVLISDQTPWRNLRKQQAGWDLPLNETAFIEAIQEAASMNDETFQQWCKGAWQFANDYIAKSDIKNQYLKLFS
ncbi:MAG: glycosyltransferase [Agriterribacter sp.]